MPRAKPRARIFKLLLMAALVAVISVGNTAMAERLRIIPVPPHVSPQWIPMPDVPQVFFAPNLPTDVFRHRGRYYLYWEGVWYRSSKIKGPWSRLEPPPAILSQIPPSYFKTMPQAGAQPPAGIQPPAAAAPGQPPPGEVLLTPDGKPAVPPPAAPAPPTPPAAVQPPAPQPPAEPPAVTPAEPPAAPQPQPPAAPAPPPGKEESAPLAVPEGPMPKAM